MNVDPAARIERAISTLPFSSGTRIVVAVSGGRDSMVLLDALARTAGPRDWHLLVTHVNHGLRGRECEDDERFVTEQAELLGLPCTVRRVATSALAATPGVSVEMAARALRYAALRDVAHEWGAETIATGHTADDQVETIVMRLLRGTGVHGLGGMSEHSGAIVRPLLGVSRATVDEYASRRQVVFRDDASNSDPRFLRNAVRHTVVPTLRALQPRLSEVIARTTEVVRADAHLIDQLTERALEAVRVPAREDSLGLSQSLLDALNPALRLRVISEAVRTVNPSITVDARLLREIDRERSQRHGRKRIRFGLFLECESEQVRLLAVPCQRPPLTVTEMRGPGTCSGPWGRLEVWAGRSGTLVPAVLGPGHATAAMDDLQWPLVVRSRVPGDRIRPAGLGHSRKLQDVLVDRKIPRDWRDQMPVVADRAGPLWIPGIVRDERADFRLESGDFWHLRFTHVDPIPW